MAEEKKVNRKVYVEVIEYRKKDTGELKKCCVLKVDVGYRYITFTPKQQSDYAEILDIKFSELNDLVVGEKYYLN